MEARRADGKPWPCRCYYPDHHHGAFVACPDPVDLHAYMTSDLYEQSNIFYYLQGAHKRIEQPG
jgi:hypothetical protein